MDVALQDQAVPVFGSAAAFAVSVNHWLYGTESQTIQAAIDLIKAAEAFPEIVSSYVGKPHERRAVASQGVLLGPPLDVDPSGIVRRGAGLRGRSRDRLATDLDAVVGVLSDMIAEPDGGDAAAPAAIVDDRVTERARA